MSNALPIVDPDTLDARWLSRVIEDNGIDATVKACALTPIGTGQIADTYRVVIDYGGAAPADAPGSLVAKFPSVDTGSRETAKLFGIYQAEAMFYRHLANSAGMRVPRPWTVVFDDDTHAFVILLEDLVGFRPGDQMRGCTVDEARQVTLEAARLHGSHWNDPALLAADWIKRPEDAWGFYTADMIQSLWPRFVERFGGRVAPDVFAVAERFAHGYAAWNAPRDRPRAITHNDLRPDNLLFGTKPGDAPVVVVDWQTMTFHTAATDMAYFLGGALPREVRRAHEGDLLRAYHDELLASGARDYPFDDFMGDYRHMSFVGAAMALGSSTLVKQTERGDAMFMAMLSGAAHHALDLGAVDLLPAM